MATPFMKARAIVATVLLAVWPVLARVQQRDPSVPEKPKGFSPLAFEELRAYELAFPEAPGSAAAIRAASARYWVFRGVAYRGAQAQGNAWASLGPLSTTAGGPSGGGAFSGRVSTLAISPACTLAGACR
jgi:hypothetical protein